MNSLKFPHRYRKILGTYARGGAIAAHGQAEGFALVLSIDLRGRTVLRLCTISPRTTEEDINKTIDALKDATRAAMAAFG